MIDIKKDELLTLHDATKHVPGNPHVSTIFRWTADKKLDSIKVGGRRFTCVRSIDEFIDKCSGQKPQSTPTRQRSAQVANAERDLAADGI